MTQDESQQLNLDNAMLKQYRIENDAHLWKWHINAMRMMMAIKF